MINDKLRDYLESVFHEDMQELLENKYPNKGINELINLWLIDVNVREIERKNINLITNEFIKDREIALNKSLSKIIEHSNILNEIIIEMKVYGILNETKQVKIQDLENEVEYALYEIEKYEVEEVIATEGVGKAIVQVELEIVDGNFEIEEYLINFTYEIIDNQWDYINITGIEVDLGAIG